jgi:hypothetical protein
MPMPKTTLASQSEQAHSQKGPFKFKKHAKAQSVIIRNEALYGDGDPFLGAKFTAAKAEERRQIFLDILGRAANREKRAKNKDRAEDYRELAKKLKKCRPRSRCGSLACPMCARAFQKAKVQAQEQLIARLTKAKSGKHLVMATIVPLHKTFTPDELSGLDITKENRWFKDVLARAGIEEGDTWKRGYQLGKGKELLPAALAFGDVDGKTKPSNQKTQKEIPRNRDV